MRRIILLTALPLIFILTGCQTTDKTSESIDSADSPDSSVYEPVLPREVLPEREEELPHPDFIVGYYVPYIPAIREVAEIALPLPEYRTPVTTSPSHKEDDLEAVSPAEVSEPVVIEEPEAETMPVKRTTVPAPSVVAEPENAQSEPLIERDEIFPSGEISLIILEGTDWFFLEEEGEGNVEYVDRSVLDGKTLFSFQFPDEGSFTLIFQRQDHSTGTTDKAEIHVTVQEDIPPVSPVVADEENRDDSLSSGDDTETVETSDEATTAPASVIAAEERLQQIEENPEKVEETLDLLEFLMDAASDDESLAGYYYRMARTLEMNTRFQDLRKAYETYQYIENQFFLTDYYEMALERIRYLDRHFFKLR